MPTASISYGAIEFGIKMTDFNEDLIVHKNPFVRWLLIIGGFVLVGIGTLGIFLPLLPTTIFLILAAWCFARSSESFHRWLHTNRLFGKYLSQYRSKAGMTRNSKIFSITFLWVGIGFSGIFFTDNIYIRILLAVIAIAVSWHLLSIKTVKDGE